jgi:branched-chain amino acid transport system permease protein
MSEQTTSSTQISDGTSTIERLIGSRVIDDRRAFYSVIAVMSALIIVSGLVASSYLLQILYAVFMYVGFASSWNLLSGYTGYFSFGPTMFVGLGGYILGALVVHVGLSWQVAIVITAVVGGIAAALIGYALLRISGIYFAIGTLLVAEGLREAILYEDNLLGGSSGLTIVRTPPEVTYFLFAFFAIVSIVLTYEIATSRIGLRMIAIREDEGALSPLGINPLPYKLGAFVLHGSLISIIGATYALSIGFLVPRTIFAPNILLTILIVAIIGGMGTVWGPVLGALLLVPIRELFWNSFPTLALLVYGIFLIFAITVMPYGLMDRLKEYGIIPYSRGV